MAVDYDVGKLFEQIELELIASMKSNLKSHKAQELKEGFEWQQWQSEKLGALNEYTKRNKKLLGGYSTKISSTIAREMKQQYREGAAKVDEEMKRAMAKGYIPTIANTPDFGSINDKKVNSLINSVNSDMVKAENAVLRKMKDEYRHTVFNAEMHLATGVDTLNKAVDRANKSFLEKGINCIKYSDGRKVNIASYARMAVRTANKRAYLTGEGQRRAEWGECLVLVSQYMQSSDVCQPYQGKVYVDDVYSGADEETVKHYVGKGYKRLSVAIAGGLFHPNCKHTMSTYFEGISEIPEPMPAEEVNANYEQLRREQYCKQMIRKYDRLQTGSCSNENEKKYSDRMEWWKEKFEKLSEENVAKNIDESIIKSIDIEDFNMMALTNEINEDVSMLIANTILTYEKEYNMYISDAHFGSFYDQNTGKKALFQIIQNAYGLTEININSSILKGKTIQDMDEMIKNSTNNLAQNLKEAVIHECGHAKTYYGKKAKEVEEMVKELSGMGIEGISDIATTDGAECIAEVEILLFRGEQVSQEAMELYNKYVR